MYIYTQKMFVKSMSAENAYNALMNAIKGPVSIAEAREEEKQKEADFNENFKQHHHAQSELVSWLQTWKGQHGVAGKRKPLERDTPDVDPIVTEPVNQRRRVVVKARKLIDE